MRQRGEASDARFARCNTGNNSKYSVSGVHVTRLTPRSMRPKPRGGRNEPAFLPVVLEALAQQKGRSMRDTAHITRQNALRFFGLRARDTDPCA